MLNMNQYNEKEADSMDRLIRSALIAAAEKLPVPKKRKLELLKKIKQETKK